MIKKPERYPFQTTDKNICTTTRRMKGCYFIALKHWLKGRSHTEVVRFSQHQNNFAAEIQDLSGKRREASGKKKLKYLETSRFGIGFA